MTIATSIHRDFIRKWISENLPPIIFLSAYFFTVVIGNVIYASPYGEKFLQASGLPMEMLTFHGKSTIAYWILLFLPFAITPIVIKITRSIFQKKIAQLAYKIPEFGKLDYFLIMLLCYGFVFYSFADAGAFQLSTLGNDAVSSVEARFQIISRIGFPSRVVLMAILTYYSFYSTLRAMRNDGIFWSIFTVVNLLLVSFLLITLNMKWPVLIFYIGLLLTVYVHSRRNVYTKTIFGGILIVIVYWAISAHVLRVKMPSLDTQNSTMEQGSGIGVSKPGMDSYTVLAKGDKWAGAADALIDNIRRVAPTLLFAAINRMAIAYPYYYEVFTHEGNICGGVIAQAQRGPKCRPSTLIYTRIFGLDGFEGRGTAPAAVHISAYALGGWMLAVFALFSAAFILGLFATLPLSASATVGAFGVVGALAGYHFSQLPGEAPLLYDHGFIWIILIVATHFFLSTLINLYCRGGEISYPSDE